MESKLLSFINKYFDQPNVGDTDANKGQCVGLVEVWADEFNCAHDWGNAKDLLANADPNSFQVIYNTPQNFPISGDIIVWGDSWGNGYGHTGIVVAADASNFNAYEQNNPIGATPQINYHPNYSGVIGWLRIKKIIPPTVIVSPMVTYTNTETGNSVTVEKTTTLPPEIQATTSYNQPKTVDNSLSDQSFISILNILLKKLFSIFLPTK